MKLLLDCDCNGQWATMGNQLLLIEKVLLDFWKHEQLNILALCILHHEQ